MQFGSASLMLGVADQRGGGSLILESSSSPTTIKKPESKDSGFFSSVESGE